MSDGNLRLFRTPATAPRYTLQELVFLDVDGETAQPLDACACGHPSSQHRAEPRGDTVHYVCVVEGCPCQLDTARPDGTEQRDTRSRAS